MTETKTVPNWAKALGLAAFILAGIFAVVGDGSDDRAPAGEPTLPESTAWGNCKEAVKEKLNYPESADFSLFSTTIKHTGSGYDIAGSLTAKNGFGVKSEFGFSCLVDEDGSTRASLTE